MPTLKLIVPTLGYAPDARRLEQAYAGVPGVFGVVANCRAHCVEIDFEDDEVSFTHLMQIAKEAGFEAQLGG